jgi:Fe-S-cluster containining protein
MMEARETGRLETERRKAFLDALSGVYEEWAARFPLACRKGCSACCTSSVTMTSLEGSLILDLLRKEGRKGQLLPLLARTGPPASRPAMTTNEFAAACLRHCDVSGDAPGGWDFSPCIFLEDDACTIYEARPFGCRSFGSFVPCGAGAAAETAPIHLAVNTVFTQIIEGAGSNGGFWGIMTDILRSLVPGSGGEREIHLRAARPVPGFLLAGRERKVVRPLLEQLRATCTARGIGTDLIDNCMLME